MKHRVTETGALFRRLCVLDTKDCVELFELAALFLRSGKEDQHLVEMYKLLKHERFCGRTTESSIDAM